MLVTTGQRAAVKPYHVRMQSPAVQLVVKRKALKPVTQITSIYFLGLSISVSWYKGQRIGQLESKSFPKLDLCGSMRELRAA